MIGVFLILTLKGLFFYFGYREDYRRDQKEFWFTCIGTPIALLVFVLFSSSAIAMSWILFKLFEWFIHL